MASWMKCECGHVLHTNMFAGAGVFLLMLDADYDELAGSPNEADDRELFIRSRPVYRCGPCGRLYVRWERGGAVTMYNPESTEGSQPDPNRVPPSGDS